LASYRAVAFDLFDTLVDFDISLFPVAEIDGKEEKTTSKAAYDALYEGGFLVPNYQAFHQLWIQNSKEVWGERNNDPELKEVRSIHRFRRLMELLVAIPAQDRERAALTALNAHMYGIENSVVFDTDRLDVLGRIKEAGLPIALLSNFDHAPTARRIIDNRGITPYMDSILISEDEGFRKPASSLFLKVAEELGVAPGEVLFVGDTFDADVTGPQSVGMPCAWLNRKGAPVPEGCKPPDFEIEDLRETLSILGI